MSRRPFRVEWTAVAREDLLSIVDYLADHGPDAAPSILARLEKKANSLKQSPTRGRVVPELARLQVREYRELILAPYRLLYRIESRRVLVLAVFDSRRNLEDILLERLVRGV